MRTDILLVGLDGLGGFHLNQEWDRLAERMPTLWRLFHDNAPVATVRARTVFPPISAPAWVSALTGMTPDGTGVVHKTWDPEAVPAAVRRPGTVTPWTLYDSIKEASKGKGGGGVTVHSSLVASWSWLLRLVADNGPAATNVCDFTFDAKGDDDAAVEGYAQSCAAEGLCRDATSGHPSHDSRFAFVHFDMIDMAGHRNTWESEAYRAAWSDADARLGRLLQLALDHSARMERELVVIVVSDHGGSGKDHGDMVPAHMLIPLVIWSPSAEWRKRWSSASSGRDDGGISLIDVCPTVLHLLGVPVPQWMRCGHSLLTMK